ncbi:Arginyl-tRNA synthetase [Apophysomyces sp. BC1034]|nr:Arginyl-tRNA synthetase [Apophysomyces sp. BC1015]KAG0178540.1 Arginyl-tRNA synthetase [Apophysomyces sp. BC1021]KAG0188874.1 Arginyl-tRNA synthetase [Apophysomyces sp. BC1034]
MAKGKQAKKNDSGNLHKISGTKLLFKRAIAKQLSQIITHCTESQLLSYLETPRTTVNGQFALPIPRLIAAHSADKHPAEWCKELAAKFEPNDMIENVTPVGAFLNFRVRSTEYIQQTLLQVYREESSYGWASSEKNKGTIVIDYSSPNIAKPFHAGHLRSTILGNFIKRIHQAMGYSVIGINYLGDWGKQYGLLAVGFEKYGRKEKLQEDPIYHLYEVYVRINEELKHDPEIDKQAGEYFKRMEEGEKKSLEQWRQFRDLSITSYAAIYKRLGIHFEQYSGESQIEPYIAKVYELLQSRGLVTKMENGAWSVDLEKYNLGKPIVRRADGTTLYLTRDLASILMRKETFQFDKAIYVVGTEQEHHFQQVFRIAELMLGECVNKLCHVQFGRIQGISTRKGTAVFLQDILNTAKDKMSEIMREQDNAEKYNDILQHGVEIASDGKIVGEDAAEFTADQLGTSAVIVQDLSGKRHKDYTFSWDRMIDARGDTGVFLQYAHARVCGIERKAGIRITDECDFSLLREKEAFELVHMISLFPETVQSAYESLEPCIIVYYLFKLAHIISQTNYTLRVKGMDPKLAEARMLLFWAAKTTLGNGLQLIGIKPLERM